MYINQFYELSMVLDREKFYEILNRAYNKADCLEENEGEYKDHSLVSKGITVIYRNSRYKKKIKLIVNSRLVLDCDNPDPDKFIRKLGKRIGEYFAFKYQMADFTLSGMILVIDIDAHVRENVGAYLKVLKKIGKVKGFTPSSYECLDGVDSFCLAGNSNGIEFLLYDLEAMCMKRLKEMDSKQRKLKTIVGESEGILRVEVRLTKQKAIRDYADITDVRKQIEILSEHREEIFMDIFARIIPFGDYYKKDKAVEIIRREVEDSTLRRKMLRLVALIPEKKSLYLAQKSMECRNIEKVMDAFARINLSPVTVSKRQNANHIKNIYKCLFGER